LKVVELGEKHTALEIQPSGEQDYLIRSESIDEAKHQALLKAVKDGTKKDITELSFESIGPTIGKELQTKSIWSILIVILAIISYIAFAFRHVSKPVASWKYGASAIIALVHDLLTAIGIYAIAAHFMGWEVDGLFITALLTILGFSVHDTIVTFDRTRELLRRSNPAEFASTVNEAINQTIVRSLNTSITALLTLTAIYLFGGESTRHFIFTLLVGITVGTYSSIFVASPILVLWNKMDKKA
jgi:preprotein translocase subunit SecF